MPILTITTSLPSTLKFSLKSGLCPNIPLLPFLPRSLITLLLNFKTAFPALSDWSFKQHLILVTTISLKLSSLGFSDIHLFHQFLRILCVFHFCLSVHCRIHRKFNVYLSSPHGYPTSILNWELPKLNSSSPSLSPFPLCAPFLSEQQRHAGVGPVRILTSITLGSSFCHIPHNHPSPRPINFTS